MSSMLEFQVEITKGCYLECLHCSSNAQMIKDGCRFNFNALAKFVNSVKQRSFIYLSGGEPLLVPELRKLINDLSINHSVGMYSSGIIKRGGNYRCVTLDEAISLKKSGLSECYFSIYDTNPYNHDVITNVRGSYELTIESMRNFIAAGIEAKVHLVLNRFLFDHIDSSIHTLHSLGIKEARLLSLVKSGRAQANWEKIGVDSHTQMERLKAILQISSTFKCKITFSGIPEFVACRPLNVTEGCVAGSKLFYVTYEGDIYPCAGSRNRPQYSLGNILCNQFDNLKPFQTNNGTCLNRGSEFWNAEKPTSIPQVIRVFPYSVVPTS